MAPRDKKKEISSMCRRVICKCDQRIKRIRPTHAPLCFFPATLLIFGYSTNVSRAVYQGLAPTHPFKLASVSIDHTYQRITYLDTLVDLSPGTFEQYQKVQANKWLSDKFPNKKDKSADNEAHCDDDYFYTYEEFPVETGENFFDADEDIDFELSVNLCNIPNLDSIYQGRRVVDGTGTDYMCNST
jgi:hypothetical protein